MSLAQGRPDAAALAGRVVLITGAAGGLGSAAAQACASAGATVVLLGRKLRPLERIYDAVAKLGPEPLLYPLDLAGATPDDYTTPRSGCSPSSVACTACCTAPPISPA